MIPYYSSCDYVAINVKHRMKSHHLNLFSIWPALRIDVPNCFVMQNKKEQCCCNDIKGDKPAGDNWQIILF
jgi:hypothetical protein